jgi:hypothetical protein
MTACSLMEVVGVKASCEESDENSVNKFFGSLCLNGKFVKTQDQRFPQGSQKGGRIYPVAVPRAIFFDRVCILTVILSDRHPAYTDTACNDVYRHSMLQQPEVG